MSGVHFGGHMRPCRSTPWPGRKVQRQRPPRPRFTAPRLPPGVLDPLAAIVLGAVAGVTVFLALSSGV